MCFLVPSIDISRVKRVVFFDIDSTLSKSVDMALLGATEIERKSKTLVDAGYSLIRPIDAMLLDKTAVSLLAELLKTEGTYGVCISSWACRYDKTAALNEITRLFSTMADFPENWLIGATSGLGGDRYKQAVLPFLRDTNINVPFVIIDDGAHEFTQNSNTVHVDGRLGFTIYDFVEACAILGINNLSGNDQLNYHLQTLRKQ